MRTAANATAYFVFLSVIPVYIYHERLEIGAGDEKQCENGFFSPGPILWMLLILVVLRQ